jgi:hypothetical protein
MFSHERPEDETRQIDISCAKALGWTVQPWVGPKTGTTFYTLVDPSGAVQGAYGSDIVYNTEDLAWESVPKFSTDIAAAWTLIGRLRVQGWTVSLSVNEYETEPWDCRFFLESKVLFTGKDRRVIAHGATAEIAICRAFLETT